MKRFLIVPFAVAAVAVMLSVAPNALAQAEATRAKAHDQDRLPELPRGERMGIHLRLVTQTAVRLHTGGERQENRKLLRCDH